MMSEHEQPQLPLPPLSDFGLHSYFRALIVQIQKKPKAKIY